MSLMSQLAGHKLEYIEYDIKSIVANINNILNCTRDYGSFLDNFGVSDYRYLSTQEDIAKAIIEEVDQNIALFEPRVVVNEITFVEEDKDLRLSFIINAVLRNNGQPLKLFLSPVADRLQVRL
ncbi:MAG: hypothetical protein D0531_07100 [Methylococcales bacterium]|nr:MAG: hypothetical protein D0531_07100 [Methylococcales bacterium]